MRPRLLILVAAILLGLAALFYVRVGRVTPSAPPQSRASASATSVPLAPIENRRSPIENPPEAPSRLADDLNAPGGTIRRDLEILNEVFGAWQTNFPRIGNPVGENSEITTALTGDNPVRFGFIPRTHAAINARGELCDRWGTPFRFHQLSGTVMEIRSAGPDGKFGTADDAELSPASPTPILR